MHYIIAVFIFSIFTVTLFYYPFIYRIFVPLMYHAGKTMVICTTLNSILSPEWTNIE